MIIGPLLKETFNRRRYIPISHIAWLSIYCILAILPLPKEFKLGAMIMFWSGFLLPLILTAGIFGDDIASGRIISIVTRPLSLPAIYIYRLSGVIIQGAIHFIIVWLLIFGIALLLGKDHVPYRWAILSFIIFCGWASLSTTISIVVKHSHNSMMLFGATVSLFAVRISLLTFAPESFASNAITAITKYALPTGEILMDNYIGGGSILWQVLSVLHVLALTAAYALAGTVLLSRREFSTKRG